ncbi:hypothetical protein D3C87_2055470 [compost metagenome]
MPIGCPSQEIVETCRPPPGSPARPSKNAWKRLSMTVGDRIAFSTSQLFLMAMAVAAAATAAEPGSGSLKVMSPRSRSLRSRRR